MKMPPCMLEEPVATIFADSPQFGMQRHIFSQVERLVAKAGVLTLPIIEWEIWEKEQKRLWLWMLSEKNSQSTLFFYEMISRWLVPHKVLEIVHFLSTKVFVQEKELLLFESVVDFEDEEEKRFALSNLPIIAEELATGACSVPYARKILELKGGTNQEKQSLVQSKLAYLQQKLPSFYQEDLFPLFQKCFLSFTDTFKLTSEVKGVTALIIASYLLAKQLEHLRDESPQSSHVKLKVIRMHKQTPFGLKKGIGLLVGLTFVEGGEIFEFPHLEKVLTHYVPNFAPFEKSCLCFSENGVHFRYVEWLEEEFPYPVVKKVAKTLEEDFKLAIEKRVKQVFFPRNEEEMYKNGVLLAQELKYISDIPQVMINFECQEEKILVFNALIARLIRKESPPFEALFKESALPLVLERQKEMGVLRNRYPKELCIVRIELPLLDYLREDYSVDLVQARQAIVKGFEKALGDFRDFNGGLIAKNDKALDELIAKVNPLTQRDTWLVKTFFHALYPVELKSAIPIDCLGDFFSALKLFIEEGSSRLRWKSKSGLAVVKRYSTSEEGDELFDTLMNTQRKTREGYVLYFPFNENLFLGAFAHDKGEDFITRIEKLFP